MKYQICYNDAPLFKAEITDREKADRLIKLHMLHYGVETDDPQTEFFNIVARYIVQGTDYEFSDFEKDGVVIWDVRRDEFEKERVSIETMIKKEYIVVHNGKCLATLFYDDSQDFWDAICEVNSKLKNWPDPDETVSFMENISQFIIQNGRPPEFEDDWGPVKGLIEVAMVEEGEYFALEN